MAIIEGKSYKTKGKNIIINGNKYYSYKKSPELKQAISRAEYEGYILPDEKTQLDLDQYIKAEKAAGLWYKNDTKLVFDYNDITLANFSLINLRNPWGITNLATYSKDWSDAGWTSNTSIIKTPNAIIAPDGTMTGCLIDESPSNGLSLITYKEGIIANSTIITYSIYTKAGTAPTRSFVLRNQTTAVSFTTGVLTYSTGVITGSGWTSENVGNGWYRISYTQTTGISVGDNLRIYYGKTSGIAGIFTWYVWGAQVENRNKASKYVPTNSTAIYGNGLATAHGGMTYTLNGWEGNNVDGYISTHNSPINTSINYTQDSGTRATIMYKTGTIGAAIDGIARTTIANLMLYSSISLSQRINSGNNDLNSAVDTTGTGLKMLSRTDSTNVDFINKSVQSNRTQTSTANPIDNITIGRRSSSHGDLGFSMYLMGSHYTYAQSQTLRTIHDNFRIKRGLPAIA